jgi:glycosyltransferase involved in cell wall biosynthesis
VLTAHNVNAAKRDKRDSWWNRATLRTQYRLCDHLFVHTDAMRNELVEDFGVARSKVSVIPFGINDTIPTSAMTPDEARRQFDLRPDEKTLLFFGQIAPYKGLEYLIRALRILADGELCVRLIVAGKVKHGHLDYWTSIERAIDEERVGPLVTRRIGFIPDEGVEPYFKAADAVAIPYVDIFQSGVPFLAFSFGVPVIATDVGSLREDVVAETGILCRPRDAADLADGIRRFFTSDLYSERERRRTQIREYGRRHHSWEVVAAETKRVYGALLAGS